MYAMSSIENIHRFSTNHVKNVYYVLDTDN